MKTYARKMAHRAQDRWLNGPGGHAAALEAVELTINEVVNDTTKDLLAVVEVAVREGRDPVARIRELAALRSPASAPVCGEGQEGKVHASDSLAASAATVCAACNGSGTVVVGSWSEPFDIKNRGACHVCGGTGRAATVCTTCGGSRTIPRSPMSEFGDELPCPDCTPAAPPSAHKSDGPVPRGGRE
jgi:hypothetical protein